MAQRNKVVIFQCICNMSSMELFSSQTIHSLTVLPLPDYDKISFFSNLLIWLFLNLASWKNYWCFRRCITCLLGVNFLICLWRWIHMEEYKLVLNGSSGVFGNHMEELLMLVVFIDFLIFPCFGQCLFILQVI